jgi:predicted ATPase
MIVHTPKVSCPCDRKKHDPKLIVLTGGPGAGKTAILEIAQKTFCSHVAVLPEAASVIFGGGFWRRDDVESRKAAQRAIFFVQKELERIALNDPRYAVVLCDRGSLDGLAYWPNSEESFWRDVHSTREQELARYATVIHLRTPPPEEGYNHNNPVRTETPIQAHEIDERIIKAWAGHPKRYFIDHHPSFFTKIEEAFALIRTQIPDCCLTKS